jgi:hypothetical protein
MPLSSFSIRRRRLFTTAGIASSPAAVRRRLVGRVAVAAALTAATAFVTGAGSAVAATSVVYASPSGTGTVCSAAQPCSLSAAQAAVRSLNGAMSGDIVVQLADGAYRLTAPLRLTAADSGNNGYRVVWQAAPSAQPVISGAKSVTGWSLADAGKNIWRANAGVGADTRQL